jgi:hypothetical protein
VPETHKVVRTGLTVHPVVRAWLASNPRAVCPERIEILKREKKSTVYRLPGAGPGGAPVIAKNCLAETARVEATAYQEIPPRLPLSRLGYYGSFDEGAERCWLFLEDAGGEQYSPEDPESIGPGLPMSSTRLVWPGEVGGRRR